MTTNIESLYVRTSLMERTVDLLAELMEVPYKVDYSDREAVAKLRSLTFDDDGNVIER